MKRLDKYIIVNFLEGYVIALFVLIGLRIVIDLFINLDEFAKNAQLGGLAVARNILSFYAVNSTLYFRDFAGMIMVVAAAFTIARMVRSNELVAVMASGISLRRVIWPMLILGGVFTVVCVLDQELVIPALADRLARDHDVVPGQESYAVWFIPCQDGSLLFSRRFDVASQSLSNPAIILRRPTNLPGVWTVEGCVVAQQAVYNPKLDQWDLQDGILVPRDPNEGIRPFATYRSLGVLPRDIPLLARSEFKSFLSWRQLDALGGLRPRDAALLYSQKHFRITGPLIDWVMLIVALPVLLCRDPKAIKSAVTKSLCLTGLCMVVTFLCKVLSTEPLLNAQPVPQFWAWLPLLIFIPVGLVGLDAVKT